MSDGVVEVFCRAGCGKCAGVARWLTRLGHQFTAHDVTDDPAALTLRR